MYKFDINKEFRKNLLQFGNAKKEVMLISCLNKTALLSTQLYSNEPPVEIQDRISWVLSSLLLYCAVFNINFKEVYKYCELERKTFAHIEIKPVPFTFYLVREITDIKFNVWAAHHMGESVGKCFILAQHYKINLYEATKQLLTDLNE